MSAFPQQQTPNRERQRPDTKGRGTQRQSTHDSRQSTRGTQRQSTRGIQRQCTRTRHRQKTHQEQLISWTRKEATAQSPQLDRVVSQSDRSWSVWTKVAIGSQRSW